MREKPIGLVLDDAKQIMDAITRYNGNVRFGYSRRYKARGKRGWEIVETPVVTSLTGIYSGLPEKYPSRGLSSRVELPGIV